MSTEECFAAFLAGAAPRFDDELPTEGPFGLFDAYRSFPDEDTASSVSVGRGRFSAGALLGNAETGNDEGRKALREENDGKDDDALSISPKLFDIAVSESSYLQSGTVQE